MSSLADLQKRCEELLADIALINEIADYSDQIERDKNASFHWAIELWNRDYAALSMLRDNWLLPLYIELTEVMSEMLDRGNQREHWLAEKCEKFDKDFGFEYNVHETPRENPLIAAEWLEQAEQAIESEGK